MSSPDVRSRVQLSICVPIYNPQIEFLEALFRSINDLQDFDLEVILSVDSDPDDSVVTALNVIRLNPYTSIIVRYNPSPLGMVGNWNRACSLATKEFILLPGQDDILEDRGLGVFRELVSSVDDRGLALFVGGENFVNSSGQPIKNPSRAVKRETLLGGFSGELDAKLVTALALSYGQIFADPCAFVFSKKLFDELFGFSPRYRHAADLEFIVRGALHSDGLRISDEIVGQRRLHEENVTGDHVRSGIARDDRRNLVLDYGGHVSDRVRQRAIARLLVHSLWDRVRAKRIRLEKQDWQDLKSTGLLAALQEGLELIGFRKPMLGPLKDGSL